MTVDTFEGDWFDENDEEYANTHVNSPVEMPDKKMIYGSLGRRIQTNTNISLSLPGQPASQKLDIAMPGAEQDLEFQMPGMDEDNGDEEHSNNVQDFEEQESEKPSVKKEVLPETEEPVEEKQSTPTAAPDVYLQFFTASSCPCSRKIWKRWTRETPLMIPLKTQ